MTKLSPPLTCALFVLLAGSIAAQNVSPSVVGSAGGRLSTGAARLDQSIGEAAFTSLTGPTLLLEQGFLHGEPVRLRLNIRAFLQGPFDEVTGSMKDQLRTSGYLPMTEPFTALGLPQTNGGGERTTASVLAMSGTDAVVDWIHVELRAADDSTHVIATRNALLQRDGDIVETDGSTALGFAAPAGDYFISVHHRNHLGVMTADALSLSSTPSNMDLTTGSFALYGSDAQQSVGAYRVLWAGDVSHDGSIRYTGAGNDRDPVLVTVGGNTPNNSLSGYQTSDVNLDGTVKYTGADNDRDPILINVGSTTPNNTRAAQLP